MIGITNFNPIQSINSLIQPFGLKVSNKQQIINKVALATLAILSVSHLFSTVEGYTRQELLDDCLEGCRVNIDRQCCESTFRKCVRACFRKYGPLN